jgi:hypothetical protein
LAVPLFGWQPLATGNAAEGDTPENNLMAIPKTITLKRCFAAMAIFGVAMMFFRAWGPQVFNRFGLVATGATITGLGVGALFERKFAGFVWGFVAGIVLAIFTERMR